MYHNAHICWTFIIVHFFQIDIKIVMHRWATWVTMILLLHLIKPTFMKLEKPFSKLLLKLLS